MITRRLCVYAVILLLFGPCSCTTAAVSGGSALHAEQDMQFAAPPRRVVSLAPAAAEILAAIGAADLLAGVTLHDTVQPGLMGKPLVGGFARPDVERVLALKPDLVIASPVQAETVQALRRKSVPVLLYDVQTLEQGEAAIRRLGKLAGKEQEAEALIAVQREHFDRAAAKTAALAGNPDHRPLRAMRLMGFRNNAVLVPGDASFQNDLIRKAGAEAPVFGRNGDPVLIGPEEWQRFDPEFVYYCDHDPALVQRKLSDPAWSGVSAVKNGRVVAYPCDAINRIASHHGYFSLWLSADLYGAAYSKAENQIDTDAVLERKPLDVTFPCLTSAEVLDSRLFDLPTRTLLLRFSTPQTVLSTLTGRHEGVRAVGNHSSSSLSWSVTHHLGLEQTTARTLNLFGLKDRDAVFMHTGADVGKLGYAELESEGFRVGVLATAGVSGNAMRVSVDTGDYVEPGTINIVVLTNRTLTDAAMTRAIIRATEGKTAALEDLDIRSSYTATPATGTGTDNVLVVSGCGPKAAMAGGHTRLGELISKAAYQAVRQAVERNNRLYAERDIFQRLAERRAEPARLVKNANLSNPNEAGKLAAGLEAVLCDPRYAGFTAGAMALSDAVERGLVTDTEFFADQCRAVASELAGKHIREPEAVITDERLPATLRQALNALAAGILRR